jgi:uncharacterized protein (TIGR04222 family)
VNPFDLRGPEFLLFYFIFAAVVLLVLSLSRKLNRGFDKPNPSLDDPFMIAFLRGGELEAVRVATLSLMDRGLLSIKSSGSSTLFSDDSENRLEVSDPLATETVKRPIEKQVLEAFKTPRRINTTLESLENCSACRGYANNLEHSGLLHTQESRDAFQHLRWIAIAVLLSVAVLKIFVALSRGRSNVLFLILLTILACFLATLIGNPFRTARGDKFLEDVKSIFANLHLRASTLRPGGATSDLVWLASAYGLDAVPPIVFPHVSVLLAWRAPPTTSSGMVSSGSSCGTFSGCGGGGSCGGGGCGGGCGGCGG